MNIFVVLLLILSKLCSGCFSTFSAVQIFRSSSLLNVQIIGNKVNTFPERSTLGSERGGGSCVFRFYFFSGGDTVKTETFALLKGLKKGRKDSQSQMIFVLQNNGKNIKSCEKKFISAFFGYYTIYET